MAVAAELGVACTASQAKAHFRDHWVEQPHHSAPMDRENWLAEAMSLSPRALDILDAVYRMRLLSAGQIADLFYRGSAKTDASAQNMARRDLTALAQRHLLYRWYPSPQAVGRRDAPSRFAHQTVYLLGRRALPLIEHRYGVALRPEHYTTMASQVAVDLVIHDLRANGLYVAMQRAIQQRKGVLELPGGTLDEPVRAPAFLVPANWYGVKHVRLGFHDRAEMLDREVMPDAFMTLSVGRSGYGPGALPSSQLPFFVEYDHGSRTYGEVIEQLFTYDAVARAEAAGKRFPDLAVPGYAVPAIMVFSSRHRVLEAHKRFLAHIRAKRITGNAPIFLTAEEDWLTDPFGPGQIVHAWGDPDRRYSLLEVLLQSSRRLIERRALLSQQELRLDLQGAKPVVQGAYSAAEIRKRAEDRAEAQAAAEQTAQSELLRMLSQPGSAHTA